ncbi:MAG: ABC transporter permease [Planctomycetaceae bacterium]|jgi:putative ABC transport system permease protein|nr:ABC transporter permease [Planctomycetaceae bacterium]
MKLLLKLIFREAWYHRARISFAVLATMAMSCMVVWLIGSIDLMILRFDNDGENYLGSFHVAMLPEREAGNSPSPVAEMPPVSPMPLIFPESVLTDLRANSQVEKVATAKFVRNVMAKMSDENDNDAALRRQRAGTGTPMQSPPVIGIDANVSPFEIEDGRWFADDSKSNDAAMEGVIGSGAAGSLRAFGEESEPVKVGDTVICRVNTHDFKIKIVGLFEQKLSGGRLGSGGTPITGALYVSPKTAEKISPTAEGENPRIDFVYVKLQNGVNTKTFEELCKSKFAESEILMRLIDIDDVQKQLKNTRGRGAGGLMGSAGSTNSVIIFSTLVSILIVFTALSMGISERTRVFAMLRSIGMPRWKIAVLVFGESVILCLCGWLGGMVAGWFILQLTVWLQPDAFGGGKTITLGTTAITTAGVAALIGSLLAAVYPAWRSSRIDPLDGMNRGYTAAIRTSWFVSAAIAGGLLLIICPIVTSVDSLAKGTELRVFLYTFIGLPAQIIGCVLIAPAAIIVVEKIFTPLVARILFVRKELLANQLSINIWRTLGTTIAISVGLGVYSFLEISGYSMLVPFTHSKTLPNTLVTTNPTGIPLSEIETIRNLSGVDSNRFLPVALEQSFFSQRQTAEFMSNGLSAMQTNGIVFGIDIKKAFNKQADGSRPLIEVEFQEGTLESALEKLGTGGRYCLIPDSFAFRAGLRVGDKIELVVPRDVNNAGFGGGRRGFGNGQNSGNGRSNFDTGNPNVNPNVERGIERGGIIDPENRRRQVDTDSHNKQHGEKQHGEKSNLPEKNSPTQPDSNSPTPISPRPENSDRGEVDRGRGGFGRGGRGMGGGGFGRGGMGRGGMGGNEEIVEYEVCGVVTIPGWLWMTKLSGVRKRGGRTGAMLISPYEIVKSDFRLDKAGFFWFDRTVDASGKPTVSDKDLELSLQKIADKYPVRGVAAGFSAMPSEAANTSDNEVIRHSMVKVNSREYLTDRVNLRANSVIQAAAKMPLILLAISSIGLMGTIAASIRMRRFELGVLRSLGVTRSGLIRLIMAEAILISIAAIVISVGFGIVSAWCFIGLMRYTSFFGGFVSPLVIPVYWLSIGFGTTLILCFLSAIGPAIFAGKTEPSKLLQE